MKNKAAKLIGTLLSASILLSCVSPAVSALDIETTSTNTVQNLASLYEDVMVPVEVFYGDSVHSWLYGSSIILMYRDSEHTDPYLPGSELEVGEKIYYDLIAFSGNYVTEVEYDSRKLTVTDEYFILNEWCRQGITPIETLAGDFHRDRCVDMKDVALILRYCAGLKEFDDENFTYDDHFDEGDYNRDGEIDNSDVAMLIRVLAGLEERYGGVQTDFEIMDRNPDIVK